MIPTCGIFLLLILKTHPVHYYYSAVKRGCPRYVREDEDNSYDDDDSNDDDSYDDYDDYDDYEYGYGNAPQSALWKDAIVIVMLLMLCYCYML